jgi:hypothetical protein
LLFGPWPWRSPTACDRLTPSLTTVVVRCAGPGKMAFSSREGKGLGTARTGVGEADGEALITRDDGEVLSCGVAW